MVRSLPPVAPHSVRFPDAPAAICRSRRPRTLLTPPPHTPTPFSILLLPLAGSRFPHFSINAPLFLYPRHPRPPSPPRTPDSRLPTSDSRLPTPPGCRPPTGSGTLTRPAWRLRCWRTSRSRPRSSSLCSTRRAPTWWRPMRNWWGSGYWKLPQGSATTPQAQQARVARARD